MIGWWKRLISNDGEWVRLHTQHDVDRLIAAGNELVKATSDYKAAYMAAEWLEVLEEEGAAWEVRIRYTNELQVAKATWETAVEELRK